MVPFKQWGADLIFWGRREYESKVWTRVESLQNPIALVLLYACFSSAGNSLQGLYIILSVVGCRAAAEMLSMEMGTVQEASGVYLCGHKGLI